MTRWVNTDIIPDLIKEEGAQRTWTLLYHVTNGISERLRCFAFNGFTNQEEDNGFLVETQVPATVVMFSKQTYVNGGYELVIECVTYGHPIPDIFLQKKALNKWETVMDVLPAKDNVTIKRRQVTWKFYFRVENSKQNLQAIFCAFVIIVALLIAFSYYQKTEKLSDLGGLLYDSPCQESSRSFSIHLTQSLYSWKSFAYLAYVPENPRKVCTPQRTSRKPTLTDTSASS
ncbi:hypothetical protein BSL78_28896 [Apostichopus japonicus]|uniref:Uncharacterized protein n=1 Tax=Stichopus japonicus TaxID=307972 RepID=A0A2G8JEZ8_STIJA|nr:hypothetical protein BSL78_28896 [Apostichopus japonicus]